MADFPSRNESPYGAKVKAYIDETVADAETGAAAALAAHEDAPDPHPQYVLDTEKGANSGVATLDSGGKVPDTQIPAAIARDSEVTAAIAAQAVVDSATYGTVVAHGATAGTARPSGAAQVLWKGTVTPANASNGDRYLNTSTGDEQVKVGGTFIALNKANNDATYAPAPPRADSILSRPWPLVMAHRSAGMLVPENTLTAIRYASALPGVDIVDAADLRGTLDNAVVLQHDSTFDARTSLTGNVNSYTLASLMRSNLVDSSAWFGGGWPDQPICTMEQMFSEVGGKSIIAIETKDSASFDRAYAAIKAMGIGRSVMWVNSGTAAAAYGATIGCWCATFRSAAQIASSDMTALAAELSGAGIFDLHVEHGASLTKINALIAAGIRVWIYSLFRHYEVATYAGVNITGVIVDDPIYTPRGTNPSFYRRTTASWPVSGTWFPGALNASNNDNVAGRGTFVGSAGAYRWSPNLDNYYLLIGELCPVANPTAYTATVPITFDALGSDLTRWGGFFFSAPTDLPFINGNVLTGRNGYNVLLRANGDMALYKFTDGNATQLGSTSVMPDFTAGTTVTVSIAVTATGITVTRSDGGPSITATDSTYRGGYLHMGCLGYSAGLRVSFGAVAIS